MFTFFNYSTINNLIIIVIAPKIHTPKNSRRSLNYFPEENIEFEENVNLSSEFNGVFPLSQTSVVSFNLDNNKENEVKY